MNGEQCGLWTVKSRQWGMSPIMTADANMRKTVAMQPLASEILMDCGNYMLAALNFSFIKLKLKYYGTFTYITQIVHSYAHLNPLQGVFSDKPLIIAVV